MKKVFLTLGMVLFLVPSLAFGQEEIEPVVVTGSRIYTSLLEIPAPTYVIDRDEIERSGASKLSEILERIPGIYSRTRAGSAQEEFIEIRGLTTELLILVDGVPYYKASHVAGAASVDLRSLPLSEIERIEVVKGAGSALYGSMAAAGVINIITRKPEGTQANLSVTGGSYDHKEGTFSVSSEGELFNVRAWYSREEEGDSRLLQYIDHTGVKEDKNIDYTSDAAGLSLTRGPFAFSASWGEYNSRWTYGGYDNRQDNEYSRLALNWENERDRLIVYWNDQDKELFQDSQYGPTETAVDDTAWGLEYTKRAMWRDNLVSWGVAFRDEDMSYDMPLYKISYNLNRQNVAPFIEASKPIGDLLLNLGLRYEIWDQEDAPDYDEIIPKLSLVYQTLQGTTWYLTAGRFFAMPSLYELSYFDNWYALKPNADLKPEKGYSYELGAKGKDKRGSWNVGFFYMTMEDKINIAPDWSVYINVDEYRSWGVEALRSWPLSSLWSLQLGATWMNAEEKSAGGAWIKGGTPEWDLDLSLAYDKEPFWGEVRLRYLGNREDERLGIGELSQGDVATVDAIVEYNAPRGTLRLAAYNILDKEYYLQDYTQWGTTTRYYGSERRVYLTWEHKF